MDRQIMQKLNQLIEQGQEVALVMVSSTSGSAPRDEGSMMLVDRDAKVLIGTVGGGAIEHTARRDAAECLKRRQNKTFHYELTMADRPDALGMACGGVADVVVKVFFNNDPLIICGAGHVGQALYGIADYLPFDTIIIDDREEFANRENFPRAKAVHAGDMAKILSDMDPTKDASIVIMTHGHLHDIDVLEAALTKQVRYIGMIGSRTKVKYCLDELIKRGVDQALLDQVHSPVGLNIGGETPGEIAVSILAEMLMVKYERDGRPLTRQTP
ncbi:MAG TPA: dehydrogenase [Tissierellia bacterium]|nr:dehydrogenase [Tissierellia bacterium]